MSKKKEFTVVESWTVAGIEVEDVDDPRGVEYSILSRIKEYAVEALEEDDSQPVFDVHVEGGSADMEEKEEIGKGRLTHTYFITAYMPNEANEDDVMSADELEAHLHERRDMQRGDRELDVFRGRGAGENYLKKL